MSVNIDVQPHQLQRSDPSTIQNKFLVGYQGWFTCAGDGEPVGPGHHGWLHWFNFPIPDGGRPNTDIWPDVSEYPPSELYPAPGLKHANGDQVFLFSSRHPKTVQRHFHWMALHGIDGAFLQRFAGQCDLEAGNQGIRRIRDEVGRRVREAAELEGRVFAIMYDVSGVAPDKIQRVLEQDWIHLIRDEAVLDSPNYLREGGRPVVVFWGFGFNDRNHDPATIRAIISYFRSSTPGGAYIIAGTPTHWRTSKGDADTNPEFLDVWLREFDAISPWTVGRYGNEEDADRFAEENVKRDIEFIKLKEKEGGRQIDYMPVVLPGGSGYNLSEGKWKFNDMKRNGGRFLWKQVFNVQRLGVKIIYGAMWDEYDEGTAYMPVVSKKSMLPVHPKYRFIALDEDGYDLPSDWYMRICGLAAESLRGQWRMQEEFPLNDLQDYWSTRPRYAPTSSSTSLGDSSARQDDYPAEPPPPYSFGVEASRSEPLSYQHATRSNPISPSGSPPSPVLANKPSRNVTRQQVSPYSSPSPPPVHMASRPITVHSISPGSWDAAPPPLDHRLLSLNQSSSTAVDGTGRMTFMPSPDSSVQPSVMPSRSDFEGPLNEFRLSHASSPAPPVPPQRTRPLVSSGRRFDRVHSPQPVSFHPPHHSSPDVYVHSQGHHPPDQPLGAPSYGQPGKSHLLQPGYDEFSRRTSSSDLNPNDFSSRTASFIMNMPEPATVPRIAQEHDILPLPQSTSVYSPHRPQAFSGPMYTAAPSTSYLPPVPSHQGDGTVNNRAWDTVGKVAGPDAQRHLEKGVKTLAQTGNKILNKFKQL